MTKQKKVIITSAPGKVILFGEHAVVYDKLGIACAINKKCFVRVFPFEERRVLVESESPNFTGGSLFEQEIFDLRQRIKILRKQGKFNEIKELSKKDPSSSGFFVIANILEKYGFQGMKIRFKIEVPKNLGSSSSLFSALTLGISKFLGKNLSKKEISDIAFLGDLVAHGGTPSGIDNNTVTYGGYLRYKKSEGIKPLDIVYEMPLLIVNSGESAKTADMVCYVREQKEKKPEFVDSILNSLDKISEKALESLISKDLEKIGDLMFKYYQELRKLNISTPKLDQIIDIALENKALGAKPTGGWGGGCCLVLAKDQEQINNLIKKFKKNGFDSFQAKIGVEGVKEIL